MTDYVQVKVLVSDAIEKEILGYRLGEAGADSLEEREGEVIAYFTRESWDEVSWQFSGYNPSVSDIPHQNWNAIWEASFEPVLIDQFCYVRAPFHGKHPNDDIIDLILEPKMAFGTAHHETTYMMMSEMHSLTFSNSTVFDYGCGTAILSILAEKLGAASIDAIDIEENAIENAIYNTQINECSRINCELKVLKEVPVVQYDIVLANINRGVLLDSAARLLDFLKPGGTLLISGILLKDEELVVQAYQENGFVHQSTREKGEWKCVKFTRPSA